VDLYRHRVTLKKRYGLLLTQQSEGSWNGKYLARHADLVVVEEGVNVLGQTATGQQEGR